MRLIYKLLIIAAMTTIAFASFISSQKSGLQLEGKELSKSEANDAMTDLENIVSHLRPGETPDISSLPEPKTELGRKFEDYLIDSARIENDYAAATATFNIEDYF